ncbi:hypothetical protein M501DRAFT_934560 [Patellaria atrata CBS 101060]|uniref:Lethal giant larvae (Lgl)-like C-terminal domain-containing protein n=1 Tax=Patellaria atrata CBS 101060 TaxID=1346257 RepID=A0A9P4S9J9_9PEZI|nr:hypothetical protein M501DRAFT_934560 [Patellaria atrata CBS 101060]
MAHLLRGKQAGIETDLSRGIAADLFQLDDIERVGINSQISALAYDPVQSLIAVGTSDTKFGHGQIYVFGQKRISVVLPLGRKSSVKLLQFCAEKLICLDSKNDLSIFSLETKALIASYSPPGIVTALTSDPTLDYALIGTQNGEVLAYDLDREALAPFKLPNFWREQNPRSRLVPIVTLSLHPRDVGSLLIGYSEGAVIYSFKQNKPARFFQYQLPKGAPGGDSDPSSVPTARSPKLTQAIWHPTGTFILTGHEDSSLVFWDPKDGRVVMARTLQDTNVDKPGAGTGSFGATPGTFALKEPLFRIAWCANKDPDDTSILIAGGSPTTLPTKGLTLFELGRTPVYQTSSWQILSAHFESPKRQRVLPTPSNTEIVDFCLIPRSSPHFAGNHDPIAIIALTSSGELITLSFPSGLPIPPTNQLHLSLTFVHPFITGATLAPIERTRWLGMTETRSHGPKILKGGAEAKHPLKRFESRNVVQTSHSDGTIRLWDIGHGDEIENEALLQVDVSRAVGRLEDIVITQMSLAGASGELVVGLRSGEVAIFRWAHNRSAGREPPPPGPNKSKELTNITERRDPSLTEGLLPFTLLDQQDGPVTALKLSDVGFVAAGFEGGSIVVIDLRGPAVIYTASITDFAKADKRSSFRRNSQVQVKPEWATTIEFSVMSLEGDDFSSILLHAGTNLGHVATFRLLPDQSGRYTVEFVGSANLDDRIIRINPIHTDSGRPTYASQQAVASLRNGFKTNGVLIVVTRSGVRIFKPAAHKGAHKTWDNFICDSAAIVRYHDQGYALLGLFGDGYARGYSIPALKEVGAAKVDHILDGKRFSDAVITASGDVFGWSGPSEMALINIFGQGRDLTISKDEVFNPQLLIPPRPTISNMQWISGTQYITPSDLDLLIGGPDRPPSKRMLAQARAEDAQRRAEARSGASSSAAQQQDEGYWAYMQRQINERTEKLGIMGDSMNRLEDNSQGWASDVNKFVAKQKRGLVMGAVRSKFGL